MYEPSEAELKYRTLARIFSDLNYTLFEKEFLAFKESPLFLDLPSDLQFDLEHFLLVAWYRLKQHQKCMDGIEQIKATYSREMRREGSQLKVMILEAETLMQLEKYEAGNSLFEAALALANERYAFDDLEYRWELALDEIELKKEKPLFLKRIQDRWIKLKESLKLI